MQRFKVITLVDITETKQYRKELGKELELHQQQNFLALLQTIGLRANPMYDNSPSVKNYSLAQHNFGKKFKGEHKIWEFIFYIEFDGGLTNEQSKMGFLEEDLHYIPIINNLTETVEFAIPSFDTKNLETKNTVIYCLEG